MKSYLWFWGHAPLVIASLVAARGVYADGCAKASIAGKSCAEAKIVFDLSACAGEKGTVSAAAKCAAGIASANVKTKQGSYTASFKENTAWGESTWDLVAVNSVSRVASATTPRKEISHSKQLRSESAPPPKSDEIFKAPVVEAPSATLPAANVPELARETNATTEAVVPAAASSGITWSGYLDAYYAYHFGKPELNSTRGTTGGLNPAQITGRYYDIYHDQIALNLAELTVQKKAEPVGFRVDVGFGQWAEQNTSQGTQNDEVSKHISQAYISAAPTAVPNLTIDVGKMYTHMGLEVAHAQDNFNYSRAYTYGFGLPFWHVGVRALYGVVPGKVTAGLFLYNGWQAELTDINGGKTFGAQLSFVPMENLTVIANVITGPELARNHDVISTVADLNATWTGSEWVNLALDATYGKRATVAGPTFSVSSIEVLAKFIPTSYYYFAPRFEYYKDEGAGTVSGLNGSPAAFNIWALTLTNNFNLGHGFETRVEYRLDKGNSNIFSKEGQATDSQNTISVSAMYKF